MSAPRPTPHAADLATPRPRRPRRRRLRPHAALAAVAIIMMMGASAHAQAPPTDPANAEGDDGALLDASTEGDDSALLDASAANPGPANSGRSPWSQGVSVAEQRAARGAFLEANQLAQKRFFASAAAHYRQAQNLWPHPAFAYNLALAQLQLDQPIAAHKNLTQATAYGPEVLGDQYENALLLIARIEGELGTIEVTCDEPGARVMLNGTVLFRAPGSDQILERPGAHQVIATHPKLAPVIETVVLDRGERASVSLEFEYPEREVLTTHRYMPRWIPYATVASGAALVIAGGVLDLHSSQLFDDHAERVRDHCTQGCDEGMLDPDGTRARARTEQRLAIASYAVGGAALAAGLALSYINRERVKRERIRLSPDSPDPSTATSRRLTPTITPVATADSVGVRAGFRF